MCYKIIKALLMQMKFKRLNIEVGEGSLQMFGDEMFVEVFALNIMVMFVVMEIVLVLYYS